jgi:L-ornithine Nalpha-acyltransferase
VDRFLHFRKGRYLARTANSDADLRAAMALRGVSFGARNGGLDSDRFDADCTHILIEEVETAALVCCFRVLPLANAAEITRSYSAQFYDLTALTHFQGPMLEIGRFCMDPNHHDPDILRMAWGAMTQWVDAAGVRLLFGCSSFTGDEAARHKDAFALLYGKYRAPPQWSPKPKAPEVFDFETAFAGQTGLGHGSLSGLPPLLRTYLLMGGWVSDHAVFDRHLRTMHVFTGVEIEAIPPTRARLLRAVAD